MRLSSHIDEIFNCRLTNTNKVKTLLNLDKVLLSWMVCNGDVVHKNNEHFMNKPSRLQNKTPSKSST